jgi:hypothetical protein
MDDVKLAMVVMDSSWIDQCFNESRIELFNFRSVTVAGRATDNITAFGLFDADLRSNLKRQRVF